MTSSVPAGHSIELTDRQKKQAHSYCRWLARWNRRLHLTSIRGEAEIWERHFMESFWLAKRFLAREMRVVDIGSGAGFPGLAMLLYRPDLEMTLIERDYRKWVFLRELSRELALKVELFQGSAERYPDWGQAQVATLRGLQPSTLLLQRLARHECRLLVLHGRQVTAGLDAWSQLRSQRVPASRNRFATLFDPPLGPFREHCST